MVCMLIKEGEIMRDISQHAAPDIDDMIYGDTGTVPSER